MICRQMTVTVWTYEEWNRSTGSEALLERVHRPPGERVPPANGDVTERRSSAAEAPLANQSQEAKLEARECSRFWHCARRRSRARIRQVVHDEAAHTADDGYELDVGNRPVEAGEVSCVALRLLKQTPVGGRRARCAGHERSSRNPERRATIQRRPVQAPINRVIAMPILLPAR
jgi:hypothetical protein